MERKREFAVGPWSCRRLRGIVSQSFRAVGVLLCVAAFALSSSSLRADTIIKADNTAFLSFGSSWVGGNVPEPVDIILWDSTVSGANTVSLGALNFLIGTLQITNPGGPVTINGIGTLQLGANGIPFVGIDMSSATADLTINAHVEIEDTPAVNTWTVAAGRTLTINGSVRENGPAPKILTITGAGTTYISGSITDDAKDDLSVTKDGTGTLILDGANDYSGDTTVNQGVLNLRNSSALRGTKPGNTIVNAGGELQLQGNISIPGAEDLSLTGTGAGGPGSAALRNITDGNQLNGSITLQDAPGVVRINSDSGNLALLGSILEDGTSDKILTFGGSGDIDVVGVIAGGADIALAKDGTGTLRLAGNNSFSGPAVITGGEVILSGNGGISLLEVGVLATAAGITVSNAALTLDNTLTNKNDRIGNRQVTLNSGTFNFTHGPTSSNFTETIGAELTLNSGASTIATDTSADAGRSVLTFGSLARTPDTGATVDFGGGSGNPSADNDNNNVNFTSLSPGLIGAWATVGGSSFATYTTGRAAGVNSVEALDTYEQTVTRLDSGTKSIDSNAADNVQITDGTGSAGDITLSAATTTINTLTNSATGIDAPAGGVTIDPAGQTLRVNGILNAADASALTIGTGTDNGTLTANTDGGELILHNFSSNTMTVNSVIADNGAASTLTKAGTGVVMVTGANSYSGATFVNQGVLEVAGATGALAGTTSVTINTDGVVLLTSTSTDTGGQINDSAAIFLAGGTIEAGVDGIDESVGALTLSLDSTIDFGVLTGTNSFRFADSTGLWASEATLNVLNYTVDSDHLYFGDIAEAGVDLDQLIQINFYSGSSVEPGDFLGTAIYLDDGEVGIPAVPEPSTTALVLCFLLVLIGFRERRRIALICGR